MTTLTDHELESYGFCFDDGGTHLARTMMLDDISQVFTELGDHPNRERVVEAIGSENLLGKPSGKSRGLAVRHLVKLYSFDDKEIIYRAFAFLWKRSPESRPLLALLIAYARDRILRSTSPFILSMKEGESYVRESLVEFIDELFPERYSPAMLKSAAQNLAGTWTQSGHLTGKIKKSRTLVSATPGAVAMGLLLGYLSGNRGILNFECEFIKLLDCSPATAIELARSAAQRGWIDVKQIGSVVEVAFPRILTSKELELIREQN